MFLLIDFKQKSFGMKAHFILYVADQRRSAAFYSAVLGEPPILDVPGMTEFQLGQGAVLGLMPEEGATCLLGATVEHPSEARGVARSELYLVVDGRGCLPRASRRRGRS
jgi:uncharacterized protein